MAINYEQAGDRITWTNGTGSAVVSGQVVKMGNILGVALQDIATSASGEVATRGVFEVPKVTAAVIAQGDSLTWDVSAGKFDDNAASPATGDVTGAAAVAWEAGTSSDTVLSVMFTGVPGTVA
jgi:predicted RecA/RadA family phage recombinase